MSVQQMHDFSYFSPYSVDEVLDLLDTYGSKACIIAGGTDVIPKMKGGILKPEYIISLKNVNSLKEIRYDDSEGLYFGANVKLHDLERYEPVISYYPALHKGCTTIASTQIRNMGTVVGNICNAVPSCDSAPGLLVLGAKVHVVSKSEGERIVPIGEFFTGVCRTVLTDKELVTGISIPPKDRKEISVYFPHTQRLALDLSMVGVACNLKMNGNICEDVKIALGAVAVTPKYADHAQALLKGMELTDELIMKAAVTASEEDCSPISDMRASKEYRKEMVKMLTRRALIDTRGMLTEAE